MTKERTESKVVVDGVLLFKESLDKYPVLVPDQENALFQATKSDINLDKIWPLVWDLRSSEQDEELLRNLFSDSESPRDALVLSNLRIVAKQANKFHGLSYMDRVQHGALGLIRAVDAYEPRGNNFYGFAEAWVRGAIKNGVFDRNRAATFTERTARLISAAYEVFDRFQARERRSPDIGEWINELASMTNTNKVTARNIVIAISSGIDKVGSLDAEATDGSSDDNEEIGNLIASDDNTETEAIRRVFAKALLEILNTVKLTKKQMQVLVLHYGLNGHVPQSLNEIAELTGTTKENIHITEKWALKKLRSDPRLERLAS